ncbi:hypothetical protein [Photobacterium phosphoreum]|uniref:hypothetical protein n=1 Tax=Photobacterium phosphoreum TaxID=659 RepID=UPI0024B84D99|nr:hypothetical protein [Photobacterium phosphoreum]
MLINRWKIPSQIEKISAEQASATQDAIVTEIGSIDSVISDVDKKLRRAREVNNVTNIFTLEEMKRVAYGKTIVIDSKLKGRQEYRVTQAAGSYANTQFGVATALSPIGSLCRQAYVGLAGNSKLFGEFEVLEIRTFERFKGHTAADNLRNFQSMIRSSFMSDDSSDVDELHIQDLLSTAQYWNRKNENGSIVLEEPVELDQGELEIKTDVVWGADGFDDWDLEEPNVVIETDELIESVEFKDEYFGLSSNFYLNPTSEQYKIMSNTLDTGPMLVEGIAGSGKTCAALGRAKTLVDLAKVVPDENDEYEATDFFVQESSVGIVRTGELVQYLKQTCNELGLSHLPIIEFDELRTRLRQSRDIEQRSKTDNTPKYSIADDVSDNDYAETTMAWLESFDKALFKLLVSRVNKVVDQLVFDTSKYEVSKQSSLLLLSKLAQQLQVKLQANIERWTSTRLNNHFACENLIAELYQLINATLKDSIEKRGYWFTTITNDVEFTTRLQNLFDYYRFNHYLFIDRDERTCFQLATEDDLSTFIEKCKLVELSIDGSLSEVDINTSFSYLWDRIAEEDGKYLVGRSAEGAVYKGKLVDISQLSFLRIEKRLFVLPELASQVRPFERPNPYQATIIPNSKNSKPTLFSSYIKSRLVPRLFNHWHIADLYRDTLLLDESKWSQDKVDALDRLVGKKLNAHDVDVLLAMSHVLGIKDSEKYESVPVRWQCTQYYRSVFVDEVQDFTEIQIFIMGQQASPEYDAVTMVGDMYQQIKQGRAKNLEACFPYRKLSKHLLIENKRQEFNAVLGSVSQLFRRIVQGDLRLSNSREEIQLHLNNISASNGYTFSDCGLGSCHEEILDIVRSQPQTRTIAVLAPNLDLATALEEQLREGLKEAFRESYVSDTVQLNKKYQIHFSSPEHIKGLEFDTVILAGIEDIDWTQRDEVNGVYVALSRPRKELHVLSYINKLPEKVARLFKGDLTVDEVWQY